MEDIKKIAKQKKRYVHNFNKYKDIKTFDENGIEILPDDSRVIAVKLKTPSQAFNEFNDDKNDFMNSSLYDYVDSYAKKISVSKSLSIKIDVEATETQKKQIKKCFDEQFLYGLKKAKQMLTLNTISSCALLGGGLIAIIISFVLSQFNVGEFYNSLVNIFGTFFMWQACEGFFISRKELKYKYIRSINLYEANILFVNTKKKKKDLNI